jgi:glutamine synthetase
MREVLGAHLLERFIETKEMEWNAFQKQVTPWELEAYLDSY